MLKTEERILRKKGGRYIAVLRSLATCYTTRAESSNAVGGGVQLDDLEDTIMRDLFGGNLVRGRL